MQTSRLQTLPQKIVSNPPEIHENVARALALALLERGVETIHVSDHAVAILVPEAPAWPIWVTSVSVAWRTGYNRDDYERHPIDGAIDALADRVVAVMPTAETNQDGDVS